MLNSICTFAHIITYTRDHANTFRTHLPSIFDLVVNADYMLIAHTKFFTKLTEN